MKDIARLTDEQRQSLIDLLATLPSDWHSIEIDKTLRNTGKATRVIIKWVDGQREAYIHGVDR